MLNKKQKVFLHLIASAVLYSTNVTAALAQGAYPQETQITYEGSSSQANDVYAPRLMHQSINGQDTIVMYFGGWYHQDYPPTDAIYRAVCSSPNYCDSIQKIIDPQASGLGTYGLLNNPTVVEINYNGQDYYVMYMVGVASDNDANAGTDNDGNNKIYYSTSYAGDGINWSTPQLLLSNAWLPSATIGPNGHVLLTVNSNGNQDSNGNVLPYLSQIDMDVSGINYLGLNPISIINADSSSSSNAYENVQALYKPPSDEVPGGLFQITAQIYPGQINGRQQIDYLDSTGQVNSDGTISWVLRHSDIVPGGMTPGVHPDTSCWIYYGKDGGNFTSNIFFKSWC